MPFVQVTRQMAERRASRRRTRQQFEIESLSSSTRGVQAAAQEEQQKALQDYQKMLAQYNTQQTSYEQAALAYQQRASDFERRAQAYSQLTELPGLFATTRGDNPYVFSYSDSSFGSRAGVTDAGGGAFRISDPSRFYIENIQRDPTTGLFFSRIFQRGGPDPGEFTEKFTMQAPTAPSASGVTEATQAAQRQIEEQDITVEREIGERRAATMRARRRMTDRPLLSGE